MLTTEMTFMGHRITKEGVQADPSKIAAICAMPSPSDVHSVKRFCGMVQYLRVSSCPNVRAVETLDEKRYCLELDYSVKIM